MPENPKPLSGKVILITGASRGIGAAAAKRVGRAGATVIVNYLQNRGGALKVLEEVEKAGAQGMVFQADVTQLKPVEAMGRAVQEKFGAVNVLVSNAYFPFEVNPAHQLSWDGLKKALEEELGALHNLTKVFVPSMSEKKKGKSSL
jgi:3-oxoacyl-[acyl-carrier protein] reductase